MQAQIAALSQRDGLSKVGITRPYPSEWDSVPYPHKFKPPTLHSYDGKGSPNQHIYYFRSQTGNVIDKDAIMVRLFIGTLKGAAFDWFRSLQPNSINSWVDLENLFLSRFYEDDTEITMGRLLDTKQGLQESVRDYIERFRNLSLLAPAGMPITMLLQTCRYNFLNKVEERMGAVKAHTWKELVEQAEIAEKSANRRNPPTPKPKWQTNNGGSDDAESSQSEDMEIMAADTFAAEAPTNKPDYGTEGYKPPQRQYSFKDGQVEKIFHLLLKGNKLKLPEPMRPNDVGRTSEPNYCLYHRMVQHPTSKCYALKNTIQSLIEAGIVTSKAAVNIAS